MSPPARKTSDASSSLRWLSRPGFLAANTYLLGAQDSRNKAPPQPFAGPTISSGYFPDTDRHASGLCCYSSDHLRGLTEKDGDIAPLQQKQDKQDCLTDSESDNEEVYHSSHSKPSMARVKAILTAPPPKPKEEPAPAAGVLTGHDRIVLALIHHHQVGKEPKLRLQQREGKLLQRQLRHLFQRRWRCPRQRRWSERRPSVR